MRATSPFGPPDEPRKQPQDDKAEHRSLIARIPSRPILLTLGCLAMIIRGRAMLLLSDALLQDPDGYREIAYALSHKHTFGYWKDGTVHATAFRPPLYPVLISVFDYLPATHVAYGLLNVLLGLGTVWGAWRLARIWKLPPGGCLLAAALVTVDPILINQSAQVMTETLAAFLAVWALVALSICCANQSSLRMALAAGGMCGLCVLCRPTFLVWLVGVAIVLPWALAGCHRKARMSAFVIAAAVVMAPWAVRNQITFGRPIITTTHGGFTLLLGNNPDFYAYLRTAPWGAVWDSAAFNANWQASLADRQIRDEPAVDRAAYDQAWRNMQDDPAMFAYACFVHVGRLWGVMPHQLNADETPPHRVMRYAIAAYYTLELLLAAAGIWALRKNMLRSPLVWGVLLLASFTLVHTLYWTDMRMRAPLVSVVAILAAQQVISIARSRRATTRLIAVG